MAAVCSGAWRERSGNGRNARRSPVIRSAREELSRGVPGHAPEEICASRARCLMTIASSWEPACGPARCSGCRLPQTLVEDGIHVESGENAAGTLCC